MTPTPTRRSSMEVPSRDVGEVLRRREAAGTLGPPPPAVKPARMLFCAASRAADRGTIRRRSRVFRSGEPMSQSTALESRLDRPYQPQEIESRWYDFWLARGYFTPTADPSRRPFTVVLPPPNVTGMLTMGHVLNHTLQDVV